MSVGVVLWLSVQIPAPVPILAALSVAFVLGLVSTLTTVVADGVLDVFFGPGLIRRRVPLHRIREVRVVTTPWYYGWGIRWTPSGWLWNVSGLDGVELEFDDGHCFRIGSDEPDKLAEGLRREMRSVGSGARG